jgi:predicted patatin/cPLA2 family phospholipase
MRTEAPESFMRQANAPPSHEEPARAADAKAPTVLVVEGGGLRGAFVAGALAELEAQCSLKFDHIFATSAGAASAAYVVAGQCQMALRIWRERTHGGQLLSPLHLFRGRRLMDIRGLVDVFRNDIVLDPLRVASSSTALSIAVTNCLTGAAEHVLATRENVFDLLEATMALPLVYGRVVEVQGVPYIDGGIADAIPLDPALKLNPARVIVISTRPFGYRKTRVRVAGNWLRFHYRAFPGLWPALRNRWETYNRCIMKVEALERLGKVAVIRPSEPLPASRLTRDRERIVQTLELGHEAARRFLQVASGGSGAGERDSRAG